MLVRYPNFRKSRSPKRYTFSLTFIAADVVHNDRHNYRRSEISGQLAV